MAARLPTACYCIQHRKFTNQDDWRLHDLSLSLNGNIAVTGFNQNTYRTHIDVYTNVRHSKARDKPKLIYSKEFEKYEDAKWIYEYRCVSLIDGDVLVSCLGNKLEVIQVNKDEVLRSRKVTGLAQCLSVRERREIFIGFVKSNKLTVFDVLDLNVIKSIILQGIQDGYWPYDMTAITDKIFVVTTDDTEESNEKSLIFEEENGKILSELTKPTDTVQWYAQGLAFNITLNVIAVAWSQKYAGSRMDKDVIVFYSLLSENNCSFLIVEVEFGVTRIRMSDRGDRMVWTDRGTEEWKVYDMSEFFSYDHLKETLQSQLQDDECLKLTDYFALPNDPIGEIFKSDTPTENLLLALEGKGVIQPSNVDRLAEAFTNLGIKSKCSYLVDFYEKTRTSLFYKETVQKLQETIKMKQEEVEHMKKRHEMLKLNAEENEAQVQNLHLQLQRIKQEHKETHNLLQQTKDLHHRTALVRNKFKAECGQYKLKLESTKQDLLQTKDLLIKATKEKNAIRDELEKSLLQHSVTAMSLEGSPGGYRLTGTAQANPPEVRGRSDDSESSATSGYLQDSAIEGEF